MENFCFDNYKIIKQIHPDDKEDAYLLQEINTDKKILLKKFLSPPDDGLYHKFIKLYKENIALSLKDEKKCNFPSILDLFFSEKDFFMIFEYSDSSSLIKFCNFPSIGKILNKRYIPVKGISSGGFGTVYLACDLNLPGKVWAIKEMHEEGEMEIMEKSFHDEARILASLEHPRIPGVSDFFVEKKKLYLVLAYIEGDTLKNLLSNLKEGEYIAEDKVIEWALCICSVLEYLHSRPSPVIFRDLKPSNIMLTEDEDIKLIDFGIAKVFEGPRSETTKCILLSEGYAPPEQWMGKTEPASDIYALGTTLYHILSGIHPKTVCPNFPPPEKFRPDLNQGLSEIISKALKPAVKDRFQSIKEMKEKFISLNFYKKSKIHMEQGKDAEKRGDFLNASLEYIRALELDKGNPEIFMSIAGCHNKMGLTEKAMEYYEEALKGEISEELKEEILEKLNKLKYTEESVVLIEKADIKEEIQNEIRENFDKPEQSEESIALMERADIKEEIQNEIRENLNKLKCPEEITALIKEDVKEANISPQVRTEAGIETFFENLSESSLSEEPDSTEILAELLYTEREKEKISFSINKDITEIGRAENNDLIIKYDPEISSRHAVIRRKNRIFFIEDLNSTNGTYVNGIKINSTVELKNKDEIKMGQNTFIFSSFALPEKSITLARPADKSSSLIPEVAGKLIYSNNLGKEITFILNKDCIKAGRTKESDLSFYYDLEVSSNHAMIIRKEGKYFIEDLKSTNGTYINGLRIYDKYELNNNDEIMIGKIKITFSSV